MEKEYKICITWDHQIIALHFLFGRTAAHRQQVLHGNHKTGVPDEPVPQPQDVFHWLHQHSATKQHEVETGHEVAQAEDADSCCPSDKDEAQHQPEEVAEHKHLHHVKVASEDTGDNGRKGQIKCTFCRVLQNKGWHSFLTVRLIKKNVLNKRNLAGKTTIHLFSHPGVKQSSTS